MIPKSIQESEVTVVTTLAAKFTEQLQRPEHQSNAIVYNEHHFENFDHKKEKFKNCTQRFENYISVKNISYDDKKIQLLCTSIVSVCTIIFLL